MPIPIDDLAPHSNPIPSPFSSRGKLGHAMDRAVHHMLGISKLERIYHNTPSTLRQEDFPSAILHTLAITYQVSDEDRAKIPEQGPILMVSNHPFGGVDGLVLSDLLAKARPDFRLLGNQILSTIPELRPFVFPVDPSHRPDSAQSNVLAMRHVVRWLRAGGALGVFPSGTVSHMRIGDGVSDPAWHPNIATLARLCQATVIPVFFEGRNSLTFQIAGLIHPALRTALLPSEVLKRRHSTIQVRIGRPLDPSRFARYPDDGDLIQYFRFKAYSLQRRHSPVRLRFPSPKPLLDAGKSTILPPLPAPILAEEIRVLPPSCHLHQSGDYGVYIASAEQIPSLLIEIGRLREITFRDVSEGTGKECDLDDYDRTYQHLFLWNRKTNEVIGSYRIGHADTLVTREGIHGLYTSTLFKFQPEFIQRLGPALEMGRSFIRKEYQRKPTTLALLWRGIGAYLAKNPQYKRLFGPVSINQSYQSDSLRLLLAYLKRTHGDADFAPWVKAKNPPESAHIDREERVALDTLVKNEDDMSALISEIEHDNKGMPVLLRYYLRLGARVLSFNVDPAFSHCVDGLIIVDLCKTSPTLLKRFMGEDGYTSFLA